MPNRPDAPTIARIVFFALVVPCRGLSAPHEGAPPEADPPAAARPAPPQAEPERRDRRGGAERALDQRDEPGDGRRGSDAAAPREDGRGPRGERRGGARGGSQLGNYQTPPEAVNVPAHPHTIILGRPTDRSVTVRLRLHDAADALLEWGTDPERPVTRTAPVTFAAGDTRDVMITGLRSDTRYHYRLVTRSPDGVETMHPGGNFHTQRGRGAAFVFTVTSDSHLDENTSGAVYLRTLANAAVDRPDFHFELGDTFMTGKYARPEIAEAQYLAQRYYLGSLCHSAALFLALGNHDGEGGGRRSTAWATATRTRLFPNPEPDGFYTGNDQAEAGLGLPADYYQWTWGDAQFIVLDPFRYTTERAREGDAWSWTLGDRQYRWLRESLAVPARYRFVFLHHLVGGTPPHSRGGIEAAPYWEWGGKGSEGTDEFAARRPGWEAPIHELLERHGVSIVFHGHDHMFVKQDLDGIVYQLVPQPGHRRAGHTSNAKEYGYVVGETQPSSGHLRVRVAADAARVDYVRAFIDTTGNAPAEGTGEGQVNGSVTFSYVVPPSNKPPPAP